MYEYFPNLQERVNIKCIVSWMFFYLSKSLLVTSVSSGTLFVSDFCMYIIIIV